MLSHFYAVKLTCDLVSADCSRAGHLTLSKPVSTLPEFGNREDWANQGVLIIVSSSDLSHTYSV